MIFPAVVAHADWGVDRRKRQVAMARLVSGGACHSPRYLVTSLAPEGLAPESDLFHGLQEAAVPGQAMIGFDFPIGLPRAYATAAGILSFPQFLDVFGSPPWEEFDVVARRPSEITLHRPFYPAVPGGTKREHLYHALGLTAPELRRVCEAADAETLFWTLGGKQVGKGALAVARRGAAPRAGDSAVAVQRTAARAARWQLPHRGYRDLSTRVLPAFPSFRCPAPAVEQATAGGPADMDSRFAPVGGIAGCHLGCWHPAPRRRRLFCGKER